ncbi:MAG: phosphatase PAP2 family protein [Myxococcota bacterium]
MTLDASVRRAFWSSMVVLLMARPALAEAIEGQIFNIEPAVDGLAAAALFSTALLVDSNKDRWSKVSPCSGERRSPTPADLEAFVRLPKDGGLCDSTEVLSIDRWVLSQHSPTAAAVSDVLLYSMMAGPIAFSTIDTAAAGVDGRRIGDDVAVVGQTLGATYLATVVLKMAVSRPRPLTYNPAFDKAERFSGAARLSFPSGHTSMSFASASVLSVMLAERFDTNPGAVTGISLAYALAATVAVCRMLAAKHFLTDVLVGAALGTALGLTIPLLHTKTRTPSDGRAAVGQSVMGFGGVF